MRQSPCHPPCKTMKCGAANSCRTNGMAKSHMVEVGAGFEQYSRTVVSSAECSKHWNPNLVSLLYSHAPKYDLRPEAQLYAPPDAPLTLMPR